MNNREIYKAAISGVRHSDEAIERIFDMTTDKKKSGFKLTYKRFAATVLALVLFIGGGFGLHHFTNKGNDLTVLVANAATGEFVDSINEQELFYAIYTAPLDDAEAVKAVTKRYQADSNKVYDAMDKLGDNGSFSTVRRSSRGMENSVFYIIRAGLFALSLDDYSNVKTFKVENSSPYGYLQFDYAGLITREDTLTDNELDRLSNKETEKYIEDICGWHHTFEISGEELRQSKDSKNYEGGTGKHKVNKGYWLEWRPSLLLESTIEENPSFDLAQIKDTITFTVTFNDGNVKTASLNLYFDKDGYMHFE